MPEATPLLIATISAGSAIAGVLLSQLLALAQTHLERRHQRNILLREKYEQLATCISLQTEWKAAVAIPAKDPQDAFGTSHKVDYPPPVKAREATTLAHIYFPELREVCQDYLNSCIGFQVMVIDGQQGQRGRDPFANALITNEKAYREAAGKLQGARQTVDNAIIQYAPKYTRA